MENKSFFKSKYKTSETPKIDNIFIFIKNKNE
jgi:hypothetical protein